MILSLQGKESSAFERVKEILDFTTKAQLPLSEQHVTRHLPFFKDLLESLISELKSEDVTIEEALNTLQFSYGMNFDEAELWQLIYEGLRCKMKEVTLKQAIKTLSVLEKVAPSGSDEQGDCPLTKAQVEELRSKAMEAVSNKL